MYQFLFDSVNYFSRNLDKLVIGRLMSMDALGYYDKSYRLMMMPLSKVTQVLNPVLQPVLSTLQDDINEMEKKYGNLVSILSKVSLP
ncbi:oligosaccharide flippase family protein [Bacteroides xylanisolvens]|nr:oligosaccharide flippase family protein [Bacteroides xylanisolvens]